MTKAAAMMEKVEAFKREILWSARYWSEQARLAHAAYFAERAKHGVSFSDERLDRNYNKYLRCRQVRKVLMETARALAKKFSHCGVKEAKS